MRDSHVTATTSPLALALVDGNASDGPGHTKRLLEMAIATVPGLRGTTRTEWLPVEAASQERLLGTTYPAMSITIGWHWKASRSSEVLRRQRAGILGHLAFLPLPKSLTEV
jgi:hypothetical protein